MKKVSKFQRFAALFIDGIVAYIPMFILMMFNSSLLIIVGGLIALMIYLLRDALFGGQSIGKKIMGYKAVNGDGTSLSGDYETSIIRNISLLLPLVDAIKVLKDKPRLGDGWAYTKVVNTI